jgi:hypothetical protein
MSEIKVGDIVCSRDEMVCGTVKDKIDMDIFGDQNDLLIVKNDYVLRLFQGKDVFVTNWAGKDRLDDMLMCMEKIAANYQPERKRRSKSKCPSSPSLLDPDLSFNVQQARVKLREATERLEGLHAANAFEVKAEIINLLWQTSRLLWQ